MPSETINTPDNGSGPNPWGNKLMEPFLFLGLIGVWFALQMWILPKMGFNT
mgnify:FL=1